MPKKTKKLNGGEKEELLIKIILCSFRDYKKDIPSIGKIEKVGFENEYGSINWNNIDFNKLKKSDSKIRNIAKQLNISKGSSLDKADVKERHFVQGNHEVWLDKFVTRYPYLHKYVTPRALKLKDRGYKYHAYNKKKGLKIGKLNFTHGKYTSKYHSYKHLDVFGESIMYGHTHDLQRHTKTFAGGTISAWSLGCLKDIEKDEDWLGGRLTNWNHAFAIVDWFKGGNFCVEVIEIYKGITSLWGQTIKG